MLNKNEFCFKSDSYLPSEIRDEMVETYHNRVLDVEKIIGFLTRLPKDSDLILDYREAKGDWEYIFGKTERGGGKNVLSKSHFTVGAFVKGMKFGYASATKARGTTGALESDIIGKSLLHFFETGERLVACPDPEVIADALMDSIMHSVRTSTSITDDDWCDYHEKYVEDMLINLGMARRDIKNSRFRWCVTDAEMRVGLVEIVRKQKGAIGLIVSQFPDEWKEALDILRKDREKLLDVQDGEFEGKMLKDDWDCIQAVREHVVKKAKDGRLMLYVGRAGTGKTYRALELAKDIESSGKNVQWSILTLSNNVGAQGSVRAKKDRNLILSPFSIARCHYQKPTKYIIIDEFSQWGQETIGLFRDLLKESEYLLIMGDDRQMNSFLGKGSLLYDVRELLLKECPGAVMSLTEVKRQKDNPELGEAVLKFAETGDPNVLEKWIYKGLPSAALKEWCDDLHRDCIIVTGANANVDDIGRRAFRSWLYSYAGVFRTDEEGRGIGNRALKMVMGTRQGLSDLDVFSALQYLSEHRDGGFSLPVLMSDNVDLTYMDGQVRKVLDGCKLCDGFGIPSRKFLTSEKAIVTGTYDGGYIVENFRGGIARIPLKQAQYVLSLGFAITVDKAQGNEWNDVMVFMPKMVEDTKHWNGNLFRANAFYVAVSRPRENLIIVPSGDPITPFEEFTNSFNVQVLD